MPCDTLSLELAGAVDDTATLSVESAQHVAECLRCQAELAQYRKLLRALASLRGETVLPHGELLDDLLDTVSPLAPVHRIHRRSRRKAVIGAAAAAATASAAGAIVLASRLGQKQSLAS